ncbi:hypothetical protein [Pseudoduganella lutea]|uniref:Uncharacterized protein n=1 Tax=Pseudoduganella lutea TaxID=321985 RepID=A0A4P6L627_9BURK|nr:hypothetical protein [Pseudoduganella lutea]QBE66398.1 hypothetical protein EWM63_28345 [Pseudoduganella lutea]
MAITTRRRFNLLALLLAAGPLTGQTSELPGNGLAQHDFLYAGEAMTRDVYIVRNGKVAWEFHDDTAKREISDIQMASNGNPVVAHQKIIARRLQTEKQRDLLLVQKLFNHDSKQDKQDNSAPTLFA